MKMRNTLIATTAILMMGAAPALADDVKADTVMKNAVGMDVMRTAEIDAAEVGTDVAVVDTRADIDPGVLALRYHDFDGMDVHSIGGERIGELEQVYRRGDELYARMNIGGDWFDIVKEEVMVPLSAFTMMGDELRLPITEAEAEALEEWSEGDYEQMAEDLGNEPLAEYYGD